MEWTFYAEDTLNERARKIAEVALVDIFDNEMKVSSILPRAILNVQGVLERYQKLDSQVIGKADTQRVGA